MALNPVVVGDTVRIRFTGTSTVAATTNLDIATSSSYGGTIVTTRTIAANSSADLAYVDQSLGQSVARTYYCRMTNTAVTTTYASTSRAVTTGVNPSSFSVSTNDSSKVLISWSAASGSVTNYGIYSSTSSTTPGSGVAETYTASTTSYSDTTIPQGQSRYYWVRAQNDTTVNGVSTRTNASWVYAGQGTRPSPPPAPSAPTYLSATTYGSNYIYLSWGGASGTITEYGVWWNSSISGTPSSSSTPDFTTTNTYLTDNNGGNGWPYGLTRYYWVRAQNSGSYSAWYPVTNGIKGSTLFVLSFSSNYSGGPTVSDVTYQSDASTLTLASAPSRTGYSFNGWYTASTGGTRVGGSSESISIPSSSGLTYYAQWSISPPSQAYSPTLYGTAQSGSSLSVSSGGYYSGTYVSTLIARNLDGIFTNGTTAPTTVGTSYTVTNSDASSPPYYYAAVDKVTAADGVTNYYFFSSAIVSKLVVYFDAQGGSSPNPIAYIANSSSPNSITLPYTSRSDYTFNGWYTAATGGTRVGGAGDPHTPPTSIANSSTYTLYAQWTSLPPVQYSNPSISGTGITQTSLTVTSGSYSRYNTNVPITTSIAFSTSQTFTGDMATKSTSPYTVSDFDASYVPYYFAAKDTVLGLDGITYYYYSTPIISKLKVSFNSNGGTSVADISYIAASPANSITLPNTTRVGYIFNGWNDGTTTRAAGTPYTPPTGNSITLNAQWTAKPQAQYYFDGDSPTFITYTDSGLQYDGDTIYLPSATKTGYSFIGWYTQAGGAGSFIGFQGSAFTVDVITYPTQTTFYAYWQPTAYTVTFDPQGGNVSPTSKSINYNAVYGTLPTPTRSGYSFNGWFTGPTGGTQVFASTQYTTASNTTLYAQWTVSLPVFSDQSITTTAILNKDINTNIDYEVTAAPVQSYSIIYSGSGLDPTTWMTITKDPNSNKGFLAGKPTQIGSYTFLIRASNGGTNTTDSSLITMVVSPAGMRFSGATATKLSTAKRFDGNNWVNLKIMRRFDGTTWQDIGNI